MGIQTTGEMNAGWFRDVGWGVFTHWCGRPSRIPEEWMIGLAKRVMQCYGVMTRGAALYDKGHNYPRHFEQFKTLGAAMAAETSG